VLSVSWGPVFYMLQFTIFIMLLLKGWGGEDLVRSPSGDSTPGGTDWLQVSKNSKAEIS
jgi:hypothetical protein